MTTTGPLSDLRQRVQGRHEAQKPTQQWTPEIVRLSDVLPEEVRFLWMPYIPIGKITMAQGDAGLGKSWFTLVLTSSETTGSPHPGMHGPKREPRNVVILSGEDGLADTIRRRLDAVGADPSRVYAITAKSTTNDAGEKQEASITLSDIETLERVVETYKPSLVIVDTLTEYLGSNVDMHRSNETRPVLSKLAKMAARHELAVIIVHHLNKSSMQKALYRGAGSYDFVAVARSVLLIAEDPNDPNLRVLAHVKSNLAPLGPSLGFKLEEGKFWWLGQHSATADDLLATPLTPEARFKRDEAGDLLRDVLAYGPTPVRDIKDAARDAGIGWRTVEEAQKAMGIKKRRVSKGNAGGGRWEWELPT